MIAKSDICIVMLTHGSRMNLLKQTLDKVIALSFGHVVLAINDCKHADPKALEALEAMPVECVHLDRNYGSGGGYRIALERALISDKNHFWMLDDDLPPCQENLDSLISNWEIKKQQHPDISFACFFYREDMLKHKKILVKDGVLQFTPYRDHFIGFSMARLPEILFNRFQKQHFGTIKLGETMRADSAFYGGFFIERRLVEQIGLPSLEYFIYMDDTEFTHRVCEQGGHIYLITSSTLKDIDSSLGLESRKSRLYHFVLDLNTHAKAYYWTRNIIYFELKKRVSSRSWYVLNGMVFMGMLFFASLLRGDIKRYFIVLNGVIDGFKGEMGENKAFTYEG